MGLQCDVSGMLIPLAVVLSLELNVQPTVYMLDCVCGIGEEIKTLFRTSQEVLICQAALDYCWRFVCFRGMTGFYCLF